ncbi:MULTISPECIES: hypothetical protein [Gimesia]|jgi:hypothetical protein|uniref:Uncharacterized protein n=2 Tax=Gimesia TaxID=1649453 RepID=A0A6I6AJ12_9PLAN|nr:MULTISPECIES: hypothetical protein [Gimesia]MCR9230157.1 hypothetical protein [bacterium]QDT85716.1 hypothetical protein MalM14_33860 [Gimesia chilikensis]QDU03806.1 hypothetical protein V6x_35290 [Gimesia chilikensis]QGQ26447.1 hypothetical protein F1728_28875 [Gimesia benthica]
MPFQIPENVVIGLFVAAFSLWGLIKEKWFLAETRKGQKLTRWFGPARAVWVLRVIFLVGILFGLLLAGGLIRPIQWG